MLDLALTASPSPAPTPHDPLAALKADRASLAGRLACVMEQAERLRFVDREEARLLSEIGRLGEAEVASMKAWAAAGAHGEPPGIDVAKRTELATALAQAQLQAEAARAAGLDVGEEQRRLSGELQATNASIDDLAFTELARRHASELDAISGLIRSMILPRIARAQALHAYFVEAAQRHQSSGRTDAAVAMFRRAEALPPVMIDLEPAPGDVVGRISLWSRRHAELTGDAPPASTPIDLEARRAEIEASTRSMVVPEPDPGPALVPGMRAS